MNFFCYVLKIFLLLNILLSSYSFSEEKPSKKINQSNFLKNIIEKEKEKYEPINYQDIVDLGTPMDINDLPEGMVKKFGNACKKFFCRQKKATSIMSQSFKRGEKYNNRHPDSMIKAMAYFELFYMGQLKKKKHHLENYKKNYKKKDQLKGPKKILFIGTEQSLKSLIKVNEGRKSMREALGMTIELDPTTAIKRFWYLGELLSLGELEKVKVSKEMKERAEIVKRYQQVIGQVKKKIEEDKKKEEKKSKKN